MIAAAARAGRWLAAAAAVVALGCSSTGGGRATLAADNPQWAEIGLADGARAGERAAWQWWNQRVEAVDGVFAAETARPLGIVDPPRAYHAERIVIESTPDVAVVEQDVLLLSRSRLVPDGIPGFADVLRVPIPLEQASAVTRLEKQPPAYRKAYAEGWNAAYTRALHEREKELDRWVMDRYAVFRADWLARYGGMEPVRVLRQAEPPESSATRRAGRRERWRVVGGRFPESDPN